jgi:hypothetical protein
MKDQTKRQPGLDRHIRINRLTRHACRSQAHARRRAPARSPTTSGPHVGPELDHTQANWLPDSGPWETYGGGRHSPCRASHHSITASSQPRPIGRRRPRHHPEIQPTVYSCTNVGTVKLSGPQLGGAEMVRYPSRMTTRRDPLYAGYRYPAELIFIPLATKRSTPEPRSPAWRWRRNQPSMAIAQPIVGAPISATAS